MTSLSEETMPSQKMLENFWLPEEIRRNTVTILSGWRNEDSILPMLMEAALEKAEGELKTLRAQTDEKARGDAQDLASTTKNREAALKNRARTRLDHAASLIVERIVNS